MVFAKMFCEFMRIKTGLQFVCGC